MILNDITDDIFVINLLRRQDRLTHMLEQSTKFGFRATVTIAVDANDIENETALRPGEAALLLSHLKVLIWAEHNALKRIIVLEDDCIFQDDLNSRLENEWKEIPTGADLVYLGANLYHLGAGLIPPQPVSPNILRVYSAFTTHAMVINSSIYGAVIEQIMKFDAPLDIIYGRIQKQYNAYAFAKNLAKQIDGHSDIIGFNPQYLAQGVYD